MAALYLSRQGRSQGRTCRGQLDSGRLDLGEVKTILEIASDMAGGRLAGMDILGDWSPVRVRGLFRAFWHVTEHPSLNIDPAEANRRNDRTNRAPPRGSRPRAAAVVAGCLIT